VSTQESPESPFGPFHYCPYCASALIDRFQGDRTRRSCPNCGFVQYRNPVVGVAVILLHGDRILLGRRNGSYGGQWCIPCGYVEWDEDLRQAARREFLEETGLNVRVGDVYAVHSNFHNPRLHTVGIWFLAAEANGTPAASDDLDLVQFFALDSLPEPIAFPTDRLVLERLLQERS
jgi:8-oxo-dGTP diphosphatase